MSCKRKCSQKVVIPKGMINPQETTIIEIPADLHKQPVVIAKRKQSFTGVTTAAPCKSPKNMLCCTTTNNSAINCPEEPYTSTPCPPSAPPLESFSFMQKPSGSCNIPGCSKEQLYYKETLRHQHYVPPAGAPAAISSIPKEGPYSLPSLDKDINVDLEKMEQMERITLQKDLEEFQKARRKLLQSTSTFTAHCSTTNEQNGKKR